MQRTACRRNWPDLRRDCDQQVYLRFYSLISEEIDLTYEGIATNHQQKHTSRHPSVEEIDLTYEGIATIFNFPPITNSVLRKKLTWLTKGLRLIGPERRRHDCFGKKLTWLTKGLRHLMAAFIRQIFFEEIDLTYEGIATELHAFD